MRRDCAVGGDGISHTFERNRAEILQFEGARDQALGCVAQDEGALRGGKWKISTSGGTLPRWGPDGKELFYLDPEKTLTVARLEPGERSLKVGKVEPLFQASFTQFGGWPYDVAPDGQRFLASVSRELATESPITVVINWTAELNQ